MGYKGFQRNWGLADYEEHETEPLFKVTGGPASKTIKVKFKFGDAILPAGDESHDINGNTVRMKRTIGLVGGIALLLGTMIGSGIFVSPMGLLKNTGSAYLSLIVWAACGVLVTLAALSYCELGTVVPKSGGEHAYFVATFSRHSRFFGELPGFLYAWVTILLMKPSGTAVLGLTFGKYALYPILKTSPFCKEFQNEAQFKLAVQLLAVVIASFIATINITSTKLATRAAILFLIAKITAVAIMVGIGIYNLGRGEFGALGGGWDPTNKTVGDIANSVYSGMWAYDGWNNLNFVTEELINPSRTLPLAIIIGIPLCTLLYVLINISYLTALSVPEMINSQAVAIDVADKYLGNFSLLIPILVTIATVGSLNGSMFSAGRVTYSAARDGHMMDVMSYVHSTRLTPIVALLVNVALASVMLFVGNIQKLIDLLGFASWIIHGLAIGCVIILRFTEPKAPRPFRVPMIVPVLGLIMAIGVVFIPIVYDPRIEYLAVVGFLGIGVLVYIPFVYKKWQLPYLDVITHVVQHVTLAVPSPYKGD